MVGHTCLQSHHPEIRLGYIERSCLKKSQKEKTMSNMVNFVLCICYYSKKKATETDKIYANLHSHQQRLRVPFLLYPHQHLFCFVFKMSLIITILTGVIEYLMVVVICIFQMYNEVENVSIYFLAI
jgi:hypothetical protein